LGDGTFWVFTDGKLEGGYTVREAGKAKKTYYKWNGTAHRIDGTEFAAPNWLSFIGSGCLRDAWMNCRTSFARAHRLWRRRSPWKA